MCADYDQGFKVTWFEHEHVTTQHNPLSEKPAYNFTQFEKPQVSSGGRSMWQYKLLQCKCNLNVDLKAKSLLL